MYEEWCEAADVVEWFYALTPPAQPSGQDPSPPTPKLIIDDDDGLQQQQQQAAGTQIDK